MKERKEPAVPIVVLANKTDVANRMVEKEFAANWAQREKGECSVFVYGGGVLLTATSWQRGIRSAMRDHPFSRFQ